MDMPRDETDLYQRDFHAWALDQAARIRVLSSQRSNVPLDLDHLADEVEDMGNNELDVVEGHLDQIVAHLLKLEFSSDPLPRLHWRGEIGALRSTVLRKLRRSRTIRNKLDLAAINQTGRRILKQGWPKLTGLIPADHAYTLDQLCDMDWYPANRHGLTDEE
jgi:hypothetical protein